MSTVTLSQRELRRRRKLGADYVAPSPYTLKNALEKGDVFTKLSILIFGLGNVVRKQYVKGLIYFAGEVLFIIYMIMTGGTCIKNLITLGGNKPRSGWVNGQYVNIPGDNTVLRLLYGVTTVVFCVVFVLWWILEIRSAYKAQCLAGKNGHAPSFMDDIHTLFDAKANQLLLFLPIAGILIFTVLPLIFMISMAFTSYDHNHLTLFKWVGLENFKTVFSNTGSSAVSGSMFLSVLGWTLIWAFFARRPTARTCGVRSSRCRSPSHSSSRCSSCTRCCSRPAPSTACCRTGAGSTARCRSSPTPRGRV